MPEESMYEVSINVDVIDALVDDDFWDLYDPE